MSIALKKGPKVKVVSQVMEWQGNMVLDIRTYVIASKGPQAGNWIPTGKGVQIPAEKALKFLKVALDDAKEALAEDTMSVAISKSKVLSTKTKRKGSAK